MIVTEERLRKINEIRQRLGKVPLTPESVAQYLSNADSLSEEALDKVLAGIEFLME